MFPCRLNATISIGIVIEEDGDKFLGTAPAFPGLLIDGDSIRVEFPRFGGEFRACISSP